MVTFHDQNHKEHLTKTVRHLTTLRSKDFRGSSHCWRQTYAVMNPKFNIDFNGSSKQSKLILKEFGGSPVRTLSVGNHSKVLETCTLHHILFIVRYNETSLKSSNLKLPIFSLVIEGHLSRASILISFLDGCAPEIIQFISQSNSLNNKAIA